jgi:hypothetical protein
MKIFLLLIILQCLNNQRYSDSLDGYVDIQKAAETRLKDQLREEILKTLPKSDLNASLGGRVDLRNIILPDAYANVNLQRERGEDNQLNRNIQIKGGLENIQFPGNTENLYADFVVRTEGDKIKTSDSSFPQYDGILSYKDNYDLAGKVYTPWQKTYENLKDNLNVQEYKNEDLRKALDEKLNQRQYGEFELYEQEKPRRIFNREIPKGDDILEKVQLLQKLDDLERNGFNSDKYLPNMPNAQNIIQGLQQNIKIPQLPMTNMSTLPQNLMIPGPTSNQPPGIYPFSEPVPQRTSILDRVRFRNSRNPDEAVMQGGSGAMPQIPQMDPNMYQNTPAVPAPARNGLFSMLRNRIGQ